MKALVASDLHFEFHRDGGQSFVASLPEADVLLCPGDLSNAAGIWDALLLLLEKYAHVVYTFGNHEYYGSNFQDVHQNVEKLLIKSSARVAARFNADRFHTHVPREAQPAGIASVGNDHNHLATVS